MILSLRFKVYLILKMEDLFLLLVFNIKNLEAIF